MPRFSLYHWPSAVGSFARKNSPPIPMTCCIPSWPTASGPGPNASHTANVLLDRFWVAGIGEHAGSRNGGIESVGDGHVAVRSAIQCCGGGLSLQSFRIELARSEEHTSELQ